MRRNVFVVGQDRSRRRVRVYGGDADDGVFDLAIDLGSDLGVDLGLGRDHDRGTSCGCGCGSGGGGMASGNGTATVTVFVFDRLAFCARLAICLVHLRGK